MKLQMKLGSALLGFSVLMAVPATAAYAQDKKVLIVATDTAFVPFEFKQNGKYTGFDIELWEALAKKMGVQYKLQPMDFNGIIPGLQTKNIDAALAGITIKEERQKVVDFSDPYYESGISILTTTKNAATIKTVKDLADKDVAVKTGTVGVDFLKKEQPLAKLKLFPNIDNAFLDLATGRVAAVVHDTPNVQYYAATAGKGRVVVTGALKSGDFYGVAFPNGSPLVAKVNTALADLKKSGEYGKIYQKWFGTKPQ